LAQPPLQDDPPVTSCADPVYVRGYEKPGCPPQPGFFLRLWQPRLSFRKIYLNLGTVAQASRFL